MLISIVFHRRFFLISWMTRVVLFCPTKYSLFFRRSSTHPIKRPLIFFNRRLIGLFFWIIVESKFKKSLFLSIKLLYFIVFCLKVMINLKKKKSFLIFAELDL